MKAEEAYLTSIQVCIIHGLLCLPSMTWFYVAALLFFGEREELRAGKGEVFLAEVLLARDIDLVVDDADSVLRVVIYK